MFLNPQHILQLPIAPSIGAFVQLLSNRGTLLRLPLQPGLRQQPLPQLPSGTYTALLISHQYTSDPLIIVMP